MKNKVYAITADYMHLSWPDAYGRMMQLDAAIQKLAKNSGADVHMHQYKTPVEGVPVVLVECPPEFLAQIQKLPLFHSLREINPSTTPTIRRTGAPQIEPPQSMKPRKPGL